ncbi:MAG: ATP-binding protein [Chloroflexota bacterium]|nr:ATP-binding protein [Chloroflexota bacterium]
MNVSAIQSLRLTLRTARWFRCRWLEYAFATLVMVCVGAANLLLWPIPPLGVDVDPFSYKVTHLDVGSSAMRAGLHIGDRVVQIYDVPIEELYNHINWVSLIGPRTHVIPIVVQRGTTLMRLHMVQDPPRTSDHLVQLAALILALACWVTGYWIGIVRREQAAGSALVAPYWLGMSGVIGCALFAQAMAKPVYALLLWVLVFMLVPLSMYVHTRYPVRDTSSQPSRWVTRSLVVGTVALNITALSWVIARHITLTAIANTLSLAVPFALLAGLVGSGSILWSSYRSTSVEHIRRQLRLILISCLLAGLLWTLLWALPILLGARPANLTVVQICIFLIGTLIPIAYLVGGVARSLVVVDRLARRAVQVLATITLVLGVLTWLTDLQAFHEPNESLIIALLGVGLYGPTQRLVRNILPFTEVTDPNYQALESTQEQLRATVELPRLAELLRSGVEQQFGFPPCVVYLADVGDHGTLALAVSAHVHDLPAQLSPGPLLTVVQMSEPIVDNHYLVAQVNQEQLTPAERTLLLGSPIVLWCVIQPHPGTLVGLLGIGMRNNLDPYRAEDRVALRRMCRTAGLALTGSITFARQQAAERAAHEAETLARQLHKRLQMSQDKHNQEIAYTMHDEVMHGYLEPNIVALKQLATKVDDLHTRTELVTAISRERHVMQALRSLCEDLRPTGLEEPFGLAAVLRTPLLRFRMTAPSVGYLEVSGVPQPVAELVQLAAFRILKEAVTNAINHAAAQHIVVQLSYPPLSNSPGRLTIMDDGTTTQPVRPRKGHLGLYAMQEYARAVGGQVQINQQIGRGTRVEFSFPLMSSDGNQ